MEKEHITIPDSKLQQLLEVVWTKEEKPILATNIEFRFDAIPFQSGIILATYGAIYIFKAKYFGQPEYFRKYHLLRCLEFNVTENSTIEMLFPNYFLSIQANDYIEIADVLLSIFSECTYKLKNIKLMAVTSAVPLPKYEVTERLPNALKHRALFLAHYYNIKGEQLHSIDYFQKYDNKPANMIVLGPHFHPGNFAPAFGHAIAWEPDLVTVTFQRFAPSKFNKFLDALMQNAQNINRIAFTDYKESRIPNFELTPCTSTSVRRYWFIRSCSKLLYEFMLHAYNLPANLEDLVIASCTMRPQEFGDIVTAISESLSTRRMKNICFIRVTMKPFPYDDFTRLLTITHRLESLTVRSLDIDASHLLRAVCLSKTRLRALGLTRVQFRTDVPQDLVLPSSLRMLNISFSAFSSSSFKSLIELLTYKPVNTPFIFQAQALMLKTSAYQALSELDYSRIQPNFGEIDWSGNHIPKDPMRFFFAFLFTQTRSHLLMLNEVTSGDSTLFLSYLAQLARIVPLTGLDISGKFPSSVFTQFITSLSTVPELRRLKLSCKNAGDSGLEALNQLLPQLPNLTEVLADGFKPRTPKPFFALWKTISQLPSLVSCDFPVEDMYVLGLSMQRLGPEPAKIFSAIMKKKKPTTVEDRLKYLIQKAAEEEEEEEYEYYEEEEEEEEEKYDPNINTQQNDQQSQQQTQQYSNTNQDSIRDNLLSKITPPSFVEIEVDDDFSSSSSENEEDQLIKNQNETPKDDTQTNEGKFKNSDENENLLNKAQTQSSIPQQTEKETNKSKLRSAASMRITTKRLRSQNFSLQDITPEQARLAADKGKLETLPVHKDSKKSFHIGPDVGIFTSTASVKWEESFDLMNKKLPRNSDIIDDENE